MVPTNSAVNANSVRSTAKTASLIVQFVTTAILVSIETRKPLDVRKSKNLAVRVLMARRTAALGATKGTLWTTTLVAVSRVPRSILFVLNVP